MTIDLATTVSNCKTILRKVGYNHFIVRVLYNSHTYTFPKLTLSSELYDYLQKGLRKFYNGMIIEFLNREGDRLSFGESLSLLDRSLWNFVFICFRPTIWKILSLEFIYFHLKKQHYFGNCRPPLKSIL